MCGCVETGVDHVDQYSFRRNCRSIVRQVGIVCADDGGCTLAQESKSALVGLDYLIGERRDWYAYRKQHADASERCS